MKIERINENQIRCTLTSFDLSVRDLNLGELAYGSEKAKKLFREMIQKASNEVGFEAEDIPLMVEAIPLSNESIMLIITKIEDPEELDTRFSKFSSVSDEESTGFLTSELLEGADGLLELFARSGGENPSDSRPVSSQKPKTNEGGGNSGVQPSVRHFTFESLDRVINASRIAGRGFTGLSTLYKNPANGRYYLSVRKTEQDGDSFNRICNLLAEYGSIAKAGPDSEAYYQEHYEIIAKKHALQILSSL